MAVNVTDEIAEPQAQDNSSTSEELHPICPVCNITFEKLFLLERHIKYSDVHAKNVQKMSDPDLSLSEDIESSPVATEESAGSDVQLLFTGHKMFWKSKDNIDLHIYLHVATNCVEVIPFDGDRELSRLYLGSIRF